MIKYREKAFSKKGLLKKAASYIKKYPLIPISTASLAVGASNYALNAKKTEEDLELQKKQLMAMENLTDALTDTKEALEKDEKARKKELAERNKALNPKFKEKDKKK